MPRPNLDDVFPPDPIQCMYPGCKEVPVCRAKNKGYQPNGDHTRGAGYCGLSYGHKWICDTHHDLLQFLEAVKEDN